MGFPRDRRRAAILEKSRAASLSKAKTRPRKSSENITSATSSKASLRLPFASSSMPKKISASVTAVVKSSLAGCSLTQAVTRAEGFGFISSDRTFVSRTIIRRNQGSFGSRLVLAPGARPRRTEQIGDVSYRLDYRSPVVMQSEQNARSPAPPPPWNGRDGPHEFVSESSSSDPAAEWLVLSC